MNFKKTSNVIASLVRGAAIFAVMFGFAALAACGDDSSSNSSDKVPEPAEGTDEEYTFTLEELEEMGVPIFESADKLGNCGEENEFETVYVKVGSSFYMCSEGKWTNDFSDAMQTVDSVDDLDKCTDELDGEMVRVKTSNVDGDLVYLFYTCEEGEWKSDIGGDSGEPVDPSTVVKSSFKDSRDGRTYKTVQIGTQTWMAENLNYKVSGSVCYEDKAENCKKYGRLYKYSDAKTACPDGWKIPTMKQWGTMLGASIEAAKDLMQQDKSVKLDSFIGVNNDPYGFNILLGGARAPKKTSPYRWNGTAAFFWTSSKAFPKTNDTWDPFQMEFYDTGTFVYNPINGFHFLNSVRCIKK